MLLNHVMVAVTDMNRSVAFYEGLGFELIVRGSHDDTDTYARFVLPGDATLSLHVDNAPERRTTVIGLDCEGDLDGVIARWQAAGYRILFSEITGVPLHRIDRVAVELMATGRYALHPHTERRDHDVFLSALNCVHAGDAAYVS